jgi:hypothetical protein
MHTFPNPCHAALDRDAIGYNQALGTLAVGTEYTLRALILNVVPEDANAISEKRRGYDFAFPGQEFSPVEVEGDGGLVLYLQNGMSFDSAHLLRPICGYNDLACRHSAAGLLPCPSGSISGR